MSNAMALRAGIGADGLWSLSRRLALGLKDSPNEYSLMMAAADAPRRGDYDGRGNLSQAAPIKLSTWFLEVALAQVRFSVETFNVDALADRYQKLVDLVFPANRQFARLVAKIFELGETPRGSAPAILGVSRRRARMIISACVARGFLKSTTPTGPVRVAFPI